MNLFYQIIQILKICIPVVFVISIFVNLVFLANQEKEKRIPTTYQKIIKKLDEKDLNNIDELIGESMKTGIHRYK